MFEQVKRLFNRKKCCICGSPIDDACEYKVKSIGKKKRYYCSICYHLRFIRTENKGGLH